MAIADLRSTLTEHFKSYAGLNPESAADLTEQVCQAAQMEFLSMVSGGEPYPTSMAELRVLRLRYLCLAAKRMLTVPEVAVLFRTTDTAAQNLLTRMQASYPEAVANYLNAHVKATAHADESGAQTTGLRYVIRFDDRSGYEHALRRLRSAGFTDIQESRSGNRIDLPRAITTTDGLSDACKVLGIKATPVSKK